MSGSHRADPATRARRAASHAAPTIPYRGAGPGGRSPSMDAPATQTSPEAPLATNRSVPARFQVTKRASGAASGARSRTHALQPGCRSGAGRRSTARRSCSDDLELDLDAPSSSLSFSFDVLARARARDANVRPCACTSNSAAATTVPTIAPGMNSSDAPSRSATRCTQAALRTVRATIDLVIAERAPWNTPSRSSRCGARRARRLRSGPLLVLQRLGRRGTRDARPPASLAGQASSSRGRASPWGRREAIDPVERVVRACPRRAGRAGQDLVS
jgi:hypothetical protein